MKKTFVVLLSVFVCCLFNTTHSSMHALGIPKVSSHTSLDRHSRGKITGPIHTAQAENEISKLDRENMADLLIAASMRNSGNGNSLSAEFENVVRSMGSLSQAQKWRLIGLMQKFDQIAKDESDESDEKLAKIRVEMSLHDSKVRHAHAHKAEHKRGSSF